MSFSEIGTALYTKLLDLKTATQPVKEVYNYDLKLADSYPYVTITPVDIDERVLDQLQDQSIYIFTIRIIDNNKDIVNMEARMRIIADEALTKLREFNHNISLTNGTSVRVTWKGNWGWTDEQEPLRVFNINFSGFILEDL